MVEADSSDTLISIAASVSTSSTKRRQRIFRHDVTSLIRNTEMSPEIASFLVDIIFKTFSVYDDRGSRKAVDDVIEKGLGEVTFMKTFAAALVQAMEKQSKFQSHVGCYRLLKWSCLLLSKSQFATVSKNALCRVAAAQASLLHIVMQRSFRERRACKQTFFHLFSQPIFLDIYVKAVLNAKEKPMKGLSESFLPLFTHMSREDFQSIVLPASIKMLKRNPEIILESIGILLKSVNLDLSKYATEILSVVLSQVRHADEGRKTGALTIIGCLSEKSSNPDALEAMFYAIKAVIGGNEEVKLAILSAVASWAKRSADIIQSDLLSFFASGLKEKEALRRGHLRCLRVICTNTDAVLQVSSLLGPLIQLVKTGFTKAVQRLDGIYAFLIVGKIAAADIKAEETVTKEKLWSLVSQNEPSLVPTAMISKLSVDDCMACVELLVVLLVEHSHRVLETFSVKLLLQLVLLFTCHPSWDIRKMAHDATRKIITSVPHLSEALLLEFSNFLSLVGEKIIISKTSDTDDFVDSQVPFLPSVEVQVKTLLVIASVALARGPSASARVIFCSHHPSIVGTGKRDAVWQRLHKCLRAVGFNVIEIVSADVGNLCKVLLGSLGLMSANLLEQQAAINSLSTLMSITPKDTYVAFEKHLKDLPDCYVHDSLSENDIQVFYTPEGMLSSEQGVYIAEIVAAKNTKQSKGRFRMYEEQDGVDHVGSNHSAKRESANREVSGAGKKDIGKSTKKAGTLSFYLLLYYFCCAEIILYIFIFTLFHIDKGKTAKEEARELLLNEEASIREKVQGVQRNLSLMLSALGEMAIANPVFAHSQLPSLVKFVDPLLQSPIVGDVAYEALVKLSRCTAMPLCNWALDIATALRLIVTEEVHVDSDLIPSVGEAAKNKEPLCLFERIVNGLTVSCKSGPLPVDSFTFVFPIIERILLSPKRTGLHDDVLQMLYKHMDPLLPLPRLRMISVTYQTLILAQSDISLKNIISVLYHVLGVVPSYQAAIGSALNELCLGLQPNEVASALHGVYAKDVHVRMACLNAVKCIPAVSTRSLPENIEVSTSLWIAVHDPEKSVAEAAEDIWDRYGYDFGTDYSGLFKALSHSNYNVRLAAAEALATALDEYPDSIQGSLSTLFSLYIRDIGLGGDNVDAGWLGRQGIALALHSAADVLRTKDLPVIMTFLISRALNKLFLQLKKKEKGGTAVSAVVSSETRADTNADVRGRMLNAGIMIIDKHGRDNVSLLFPIFENYLNKKASDEEKYDLVREGVVIFTGALAKHLAKDDPKVHAVVDKLLDVLNTPSEAVQRAVSSCLSPLMQSMQDEAPTLVSRLLDQLMKSDKYGERRGAAFGLAGVLKGFGISSLKKYGIAATLREGLADRNSAKRREGALLAFECLCEKLGRLFEPYVIQMLPLLLVAFSDQVVAVREAAECAARAMMSQLSAQGVKLVLPSLLKGLEDKAWRTKQSSVQLLGAMAYCAPQQLSQCLPKIVPKLTEVLTDTHPKVQSAGQTALQQVGSVIKNPEIASLVPTLLMGLTDPNDHTKYSLDILLQTTFVNTVDAPSLALLVPIVHRGLRERSAETKKKAAQIVGNMCSLVTEPKDMIPYIGLLLPEVKKVLVDPIPEVRSVAARAIGSLIRGMGEENFPDLVSWLLDALKSDNSNVERSGAAQGLSEVLAALGTVYFEHILPDIIRNCSHQRASVRDGYLTLFKYLPRSLGVQFQNYLQQVLPAILDGEYYSSLCGDLLSHAACSFLLEDSYCIFLYVAVATHTGLADENESVRDAALGAGHVLVEHYATTSLPLLLPAVEDGIFNDNWRIRQSSVELLGDLLFKVAGTSGKALLEGGSDDEGASTEAHGRAIIEVLGRDKRNEVLAALYMVRSDVSLSVRQAALHVWKTIVANTPKTLKEIMPVLMNTLISSLASSSSERRQVAGRALGELVRKLGERVLPSIIPILSRGLKDPSASRRQAYISGDWNTWLVNPLGQGVCIGLSEVMASAGKSQLLSFMDELIPTIRTALCDSILEVRESAGLAFSTLFKVLSSAQSAGMQAIDEIVPTLLHALEDDQTSDTALDGLKQILSVRTTAVLPHILPKLVHLPLSAFNAHALGALAEVAGPGLNFHLGTILPALLSAMGDDDMDVQSLAKEAAETVTLVIDEEGVESLVSELLKGVGDNQASIRRSSAYLIGYFYKNSKLYLVDEAPNMISTLIVLLSDSDSTTVAAAWEALSRVVASVPKEGLISGSAELREQAALGLGELIEVTSEQSLKEFVIPITGPLIRIIGDRFPWQVKSAILSTLSIIIRKGGIALKPFLPQLQTTFIKCLQDSTRTVRSSAALALGKLSALSTRVDPLVGDLLSSLQVSDAGIREAILTALKGVLKHAGKSVSSAVKIRVYSVLKDLVYHDDDQVRVSAASILGIMSQCMEDGQLADLLQELLNLASSPSWAARHGSVLVFATFLRHNPSAISMSPLFLSILDRLKSSLKDEKFPLREASTKALGRLLLHQIQSGPANTTVVVDILASVVSALHDDSSEVRRRALSALKSVAKANPSAIMVHVALFGPALAECLKDGSTPVRLAAERCAVHAFQLTRGSEYIQGAQKFITGLDARRLSKFPEHSDDSEDSENDTASG
ncbi:protein ILITYHIA [Citrus sinensis]|nr:protein ILITYHIA [Citrus sinensis]